MSADYNALTSKQKKVYNAIEKFINEKGIPPTVREIGEMLGEKTPGAVQGILNRLEQKGVIKREVGMARSIQLVSDKSNYAKVQYIPEVKKVSDRNIDDLFNIYNVEINHPVSADILQVNEGCFLINCPDNSLYESGIKYEDLLIIDTNADLKDDDVVLVLYENHAILRRYYSTDEPDTVRLEADSDIIGKSIFKKGEARIIGKLICKITKY